MAFSKAFGRKLDSLFHQRTNWLRQELARSARASSRFWAKKVNAGIKQLQRLASRCVGI